MYNDLKFFLDNICYVDLVDLKKYRHVIDCIYHYLPDHKPGETSLRSELHEIDLLLRDMIDTLNGEYEAFYDE